MEFWEAAIGVLILVTHLGAIGGVVLWFVLGKPLSRAVFWLRFREAFFKL